MPQELFDVIVVSEHLKIKRIFGFLKDQTLTEPQSDLITLAPQFSQTNAAMSVGLPKRVLSRGDRFANLMTRFRWQ